MLSNGLQLINLRRCKVAGRRVTPVQYCVSVSINVFCECLPSYHFRRRQLIVDLYLLFRTAEVQM